MIETAIQYFQKSGYAKELSEKLSIENYSCFIDGDNFFEKIPKVQQIIGQPYANLDKKQYLDCCLWGPFDNVCSLILIGRHFGLDIRTPFLEDEVIQSALSLRDDQRVNGLETKVAFRMAAGKYLTEEIYNRPKKGMPLPYGEWFRDEKHLKQIEEAFSLPAKY